MEIFRNNLGQTIGFPLENWNPPKHPSQATVLGRYSRLEKLEPNKHADDLYKAFKIDAEDKLWTYLPYGPFSTFDNFFEWMNKTCCKNDPLFYAIIDISTSKAVGVASYLHIQASIGLVEVGHINYSPLLQKTRMATEAMYLMMKSAFEELGYRRYEWKCDALNTGSRNAALRLGFEFEGVFRQATIYKGRSRDTAWFSIIDSEWPKLKKSFECWLDSNNFDEHGNQVQNLSDIIKGFKENDKAL